MGVATTEFVRAAAIQSEALGYEPAIVFVPHPVQDRTDDELKQLADGIFADIAAKLIV